MLTDAQASYTPDIAAEIDSEEEILADDLGVTISQARRIIRMMKSATNQGTSSRLAHFISTLAQSDHPAFELDCIMLAAGLDQLNGAKSEREIADKHNVTRALVSYHVCGWSDTLSGKGGRNFDITKFRKRNATRQIYAEKATSPVVQVRNQAMQEIMKTKNTK